VDACALSVWYSVLRLDMFVKSLDIPVLYIEIVSCNLINCAYSLGRFLSFVIVIFCCSSRTIYGSFISKTRLDSDSTGKG